MGKAEERSNLYHQFLGLADQIHRLLSTGRAPEQSETAHWEYLSEQPEMRTVLHRRDYVLVPGAIPSTDTLREWNAHAAAVLRAAAPIDR
ncbi:hypothetical protein ACIPW9_25085 [Streptomyces sp. NPDC090052]|uniref:hypothetical protein n=1 Tax=unclassified Streptomyces TaxID=2593676 RepID=UPI00224EEC09|nr:hypothetical protein [Streptomyces sp. NBC_01306]MCX4729244.1 hypothetical protein [Streptomyces sp. NBC_01306]WSX46660.1 hypothetical protein OG760_35930 [Streptomyces sp. NBC_00963]